MALLQQKLQPASATASAFERRPEAMTLVEGAARRQCAQIFSTRSRPGLEAFSPYPARAIACGRAGEGGRAMSVGD